MQRALEFKKQKDGRLLALIGDLPCYTPPVPKSPEGFLNGHVKSRKDQKWVRDYPTDEEIDLLTEREQDALRAREAMRLMDGGGAWFLNDGEPTYLTPDHYFFLVHFKLPDLSYPVYYEADAEDYMWTVGVEEDEDLIGGVFMGARQRGKTARRAARLLRKALVTPGAHLGIQSKTDTDAREILNKFISHALRNLSALIKPVTSLSTDDAQTKISFKAPAQRGKRAQATRKLDTLNSKIERRNSKPGAFDGETLYELLSDEWAKKQDYDTEERLTVVSRMLWSRTGKRKGRIWMYSTIDEKEDFEPEMPLRVWEGSNAAQREPNGSTKTGLARLFISSLKGSVVDEYGRSLLAESLAQWEKKAPDKATDPIGYRRYCRANPRNPEDGFASANRDTIFNLENLDNARDHNASLPTPYWLQVDLQWVDPNTRAAVKTVDNKKNGRFKFIMLALPTQLNNVQADGIHTSDLGEMVRYKPLNNALYAVGCDPYDARSVRDLGQASKGAAYVFWKPDALHEAERLDTTGREKAEYWPSDGFIVEYVNRPPRPKDFYEDMVKLCHLFGCSILPENNKPGIIAHFEDRGYAAFISGKVSIVSSQDKKNTKKKNDTPGQAATGGAGGSTDQWSERLSEFTHGPLGDDPRRMPFAHQIKDVTSLDINDTKKYDAAVATGWTLLLARRFTKPKPKPVDYSSLNLSNFFHTH